MKSIKLLIILIILLSANICIYANVNIVVSYPYIEDITNRIGKDKVDVVCLANGNFDPHYIVPKPSYIAKLRTTDLIIINGAQLEIGWIPPLINKANNPRILPGNDGFLELSRYVKLIDIPSSVSREYGDVHPDGNPHFCLDPYNIPLISKAIYKKLCELDPANSSFYASNYKEFNKMWFIKLKEWNKKLSKLSGKRIVEYHKLFDYLFSRYNIKVSGEIEPLPGIPPTSKHTKEIIDIINSDKVYLIVQDVYHSSKAAEYISNETNCRYTILPHDIGAVNEVKDIFTLFEIIVKRLTND